MAATWILLLLSLFVILAGCDLFTNGIEWAGHRLRLGEGAVGSVLAAVGTCLPETLIAILAILFGEESGAGDAVGIGAILGAPLMLATLALCITGVAVLVFARTRRRSTFLNVDHRVVGRDLRFFFIVFLVSAAASFVRPQPARTILAVILVGLYAGYVRLTLLDKRSAHADADISPLHLYRREGKPPGWLIGIQATMGLAALVAGAHLFVGNLTAIAQATGVSALVLSLVITPIATELPEKFNSVLWVRQGKDTLALGNISGAMVFQSSVPTAIGMVFTDWRLDSQALAAVGVALAAAAIVWLELRWRARLSAGWLLLGGLLYAAYLAWVFAVR